MEPPAVGELVHVSTGGPPVDGIVFEIPSARKVVVVVADPRRGPVLRTVPPEAVSAREAEGSHDPALRRLIRRAPPPTHHGGRGGGNAARGRAGYSRPATHRTSDH